jgi:hypothetical protein
MAAGRGKLKVPHDAAAIRGDMPFITVICPALVLRASPQKTLPAVYQLHSIKVAALLAAGVDERRIFTAAH